MKIPTIEQAIADPFISFWIKDCLMDLKYRDPMKALHDVEMLADIIEEHVKNLTRLGGK